MLENVEKDGSVRGGVRSTGPGSCSVLGRAPHSVLLDSSGWRWVEQLERSRAWPSKFDLSVYLPTGSIANADATGLTRVDFRQKQPSLSQQYLATFNSLGMVAHVHIQH